MLSKDNRVKRSDSLDTVFLQTAVHDLKTPILAMKLFLEMVLDPKGESLTTTQRSNLDEVARSNGQLLAMVQDILSMVKMERGDVPLSRELVNLHETMAHLVDELSALIKQKKITVRWEGDPTAVAAIETNAASVQQIFHNLLTNAIKYNREGGTITFRVETFDNARVPLVATRGTLATVPAPFKAVKQALKKHASWCIVTVQDSGVGIPASEQAQVFDRLFRASNAKTIDPYGTGLGLYLTKTLVEKLGGLLWFSSEEGKGTAFFVALPYAS